MGASNTIERSATTSDVPDQDLRPPDASCQL